jgi:bla regulator protein BlaR1
MKLAPLSDEQMNAICWTLIHSLWIGLIFAMLAALIIACTRRTKAKLRYRLFCGLLLVFTFTMMGVGLYELIGNDLAINLGHSSSSFMDNVAIFLNENSVWIFALWLIFFVFKTMKLIAGIFYIERIRKYKIKELSEEWVLKVQTFGAQMGIKKQVAIIQSALVKVPVTIGYFKPIIVLPIGLIFNLPAEQVETILWHELAHIYRRDYLVNILQKMIEVVFFFNPAVLWLSALIREEREACCDDIVLNNVQQKTSYLAALVAFHSHENNLGGLAMGLSLRPNQIMNRLRRMVHQENKRLSVVELFVLALGVLMLSAFTYIPQVKPGIKSGVVYIKKALESASQTIASLPKPISRPLKSITTPLPNKPDSVKTDTLLKFKSIRFKDSNEDKANWNVKVIDGQDNSYHIIVVDGAINSVNFNEKTIPANDFKNYENLLEQIDNLIKNKLTNPSSQYIKK